MLRVTLPGQYEDRQPITGCRRLMGRDPSARLDFIQARASAVEDDAIDA